MKKILSIVAIAALLLAGASAQAAGKAPQDLPAANAVITTLTGTVTMESGQPEIKANGKTWFIQAPLRSIVFLPWKEGATVSISGYAVESRKLANGVSISDRIIATSITLAGKTYEIPRGGAGRFMDCDDEDGMQGMGNMRDGNRGGRGMRN